MAPWRIRQALLAAIYLAGVAYLLLLPPWEGYDEIAHYAYAQQLGSTGTAPSLKQGRLSRDVEAYLDSAPGPYSTTPPFDHNGGLTYRQWFDGPNGRDLPHSTPVEPRRFEAGERDNWQAQHPWGYYLLLAPLVEATAGLSWAAQLFGLRLFSWSLAFVGFVISLMATERAVQRFFPDSVHGFQWFSLAWPLVFPGFFPEFARIGNDSLVVLILSLVWALAVRRVSAPVAWPWYLAMGLLLGLGGLVKVTFLPLSLALLAWLLWLALRAGPIDRRRQLYGALLASGLFVACTGSWYLNNMLERGSLTGLVELTDTPSWTAALGHPFEVLKGVLGIALTFVWGSSTSSAYPPVFLVLPLVAPLVLCLLGSVRLFASPYHELPMLAWLMFGAVTGGLVYYLLVRIAATGVGAGAPGWYLHTLIAPLSLLFGAGWSALRAWLPWASRWLGRVWLLYAAGFAALLAWLQAALFTGCAVKTATSRIYTFDSGACLFDLATLHARLALLTYPSAGYAVLLLAAVVLLVAFLKRDVPAAAKGKHDPA